MTKKFTKEVHIKNILEEFRYKNRSKAYPDACPLYKKGALCHKMKNLNCFLCYCPNYLSGKPEGGCKIKSKKGKWFYSGELPKGKIWDCSDCVYPHDEKTVEKHLRGIFSN